MNKDIRGEISKCDYDYEKDEYGKNRIQKGRE